MEQNNYIILLYNSIMSKPYIINITGIQGSGKSYICHKLKQIPCIDTDKVLYNTFTKLLKNSKKFQKYLK